MSAKTFGRDKRLLAKADFDRVFRGAVYQVSNKGLLILSIPGAQPTPRLGLVAAKKTLATAVKRNRFKRVVREAFRFRQQELTGLDLVVLARAGFNTLTAGQQTKLVGQSFSQLISKSAKPAP